MMRWFLTLAVLLFSTNAWAQSSTSSVAGESLEGHQSLLTTFHERIDDLDRRIADTEGLLASLKDSALGGIIARTRAVIEHNNAMSSNFELERAVYTLDGGVIFSKENTDGSLDEAKSFELYNGPITPGQHIIEVSLVYRGKSVGVFTYLDGYKFKVDSRYPLNVPEGKETRLNIVAYERSDISLDTSDRLDVRYDVEIGVGARPKTETQPATVPETPDIVPDTPDVPPPADESGTSDNE
ncbi:MAG: dihydrolipoamide acetyltransferase [Deltaproteobacteria bacterium]